MRAEQVRLAPRAVPGGFIEAALASVCAEYGVSRLDLLAKDRHLTIATARHVAAWVIRRAFRLSYPEIGRLLNRDHTTIMNSVERINAAVEAGVDAGRVAEQLLSSAASGNGATQ